MVCLFIYFTESGESQGSGLRSQSPAAMPAFYVGARGLMDHHRKHMTQGTLYFPLSFPKFMDLYLVFIAFI